MCVKSNPGCDVSCAWFEQASADLDDGVSNFCHGHAAREASRGVAVRHIGDELQSKLACIHDSLQV